MKQNKHYAGSDIRAVENPYGAAFDLAERLDRMTGSTRWMLKGLSVYFFLYFISALLLALFVAFLTLVAYMLMPLEIDPNIDPLIGPLVVLGFLFLLFLIIVLCLALTSFLGSYRSDRFLKHLKSHHDLMLRIRSPPRYWAYAPGGDHGPRAGPPRYWTYTPGGDHAPRTGPLPDARAGPPPPYMDDGHCEMCAATSEQESPAKGLIGLIKSAARHSVRLADTNRSILVFIAALWMFTALLTVLFLAESPDGGLLCCASGPFLVLIAVIAVTFTLGDRFDFVRKRYEAIEYAMTAKPARIPGGKTPARRFQRYLAGRKGYEALKKKDAWGRDGYFDAVAFHANGWIFIKSLDRPPGTADLAQFRQQVASRQGGHPVDRAVIVHRDDERHALTQEAYDDVIHRPLVHGADVCSIQLVEEGSDGRYDFVPMMSY